MYEYMMYVQIYIYTHRYMYIHMCYIRSHYPLILSQNDTYLSEGSRINKKIANASTNSSIMLFAY